MHGAKQKLSPLTFSDTMDILTEPAVIRATAHLLACLAFGNLFLLFLCIDDGSTSHQGADGHILFVMDPLTTFLDD